MKLTKLIPPYADTNCGDDGDCPAVYASDGELAAVQGPHFADPDIEMAADEGMVLVPKALLRALAAQLAEL